MKKQKGKSLLFIIRLVLAALLLAGFAIAQDKSTDTGKGQSSDKEKKEKPQPPRKRDVEKVGSIFDDQADEFEEPTYTPPADIEEKIKSIPPIPGNIKKHFQEKYMKIDRDPSVTLQQTQYGPSGKIWIDGDLTPKTASKSVIDGESREDRARIMAKAFIEEEVSLLGVHNLEELKEFSIKTDKGYGGIYTDINYRRYIDNLELENSYIRITVGPNETIIGVSAEAVAPPPALYQAVAKKTLGRGKIFRIIAQDLKMPITGGGSGASSVGVSGGHKVAIPKPPYVIWKVGTMDWDYKIDAFTGEILEKISTRRWLVNPGGNHEK